jgi:hypothetical protein
VRFLVVLVAVETATVWNLAHQPLTTLGLLCWALALYSLGWMLYSLWELAASPRKHRVTNHQP